MDDINTNLSNIVPIKLLSSKYNLLILIIIAFIYNIVVYKNNVILIIMFFIIMYFFKMYNILEKINNNSFKTSEEIKKKLITDLTEKDISYHKNNKFFMNNPNLYKVFKKPTDFYFFKNNIFMQEIVYDLRFIEKYDKADFLRMTILIDQFLKTYYFIINDRYDYTYTDILIDIRLELLNTMNNFIIDAPMFSKDKTKRLDELIHHNQLKVQAYTFKKLKNISKKYPHFNAKNPKGYNETAMKDNYNIIV